MQWIEQPDLHSDKWEIHTAMYMDYHCTRFTTRDNVGRPSYSYLATKADCPGIKANSEHQLTELIEKTKQLKLF